jgi:serine/threonine-protein kinase
VQALGPYEVVRELGRGGMGAVYEGRDPRVDRRVALKVVLDPLTDPEALTRFEREAQLLARVHHPGVVRVHGVYGLTALDEEDRSRGATS